MRLKGFVIYLLAIMSLHLCCYGQVRLGVSLPMRTYMIGESIAADVILENQGTVPLVFGQEHQTAELLVELRSKAGNQRSWQPAAKKIRREVVLMPGSTIRDVVELTSLYDYLAPGSHQVSIVVDYAGSRFSSKSFGFDVIRGMEMASYQTVLPGYQDMRVVYSLRYASREGREVAFMVIESEDGRRLYGSFMLGTVVRLFKPVIQASRGNVVAVHQSGRNRFTRSVFNVDRTGAEFVAQKHYRADGRLIPED